MIAKYKVSRSCEYRGAKATLELNGDTTLVSEVVELFKKQKILI